MNRGIILLLIAECCFAAATVFAKFVTNHADIPATELTFFRVTIGVLITGLYMIKTGTSFIPNKFFWVIIRAIFSFTALITFFYAVKFSSITNANMLNMTYPVFIFLLAPVFRLERIKGAALVFLIMAVIGIYLIVFPDFSNINKGDVVGLISGITGAVAIIALSKARHYDSTVLIVFYLMAIGSFINTIMVIPVFVMPGLRDLAILLISGIIGVTGQLLLTSGYKYITARTGSMVSSSRIVFAAIFGFIFFSEPMTLKIVSGGILIIMAIVGINALQKFSTVDEE